MSTLDVVIVAGYFAAVTAIGLHFRRRQVSTEQYFLGGRSLPGWVVAFSLIGTMIGSTSFIGHPGEVYRDSMWVVPTFATLPLVMAFVSRHVVPLYRNRLQLSVYGYLERRFGYAARAYGAAGFLLSRVVDVGATLFFLGAAVSTLTGLDLRLVIVVTGSLTVLYTLVGGFAAVAWTEVLQSLLLLAGLAIVLATALFGAPRGGAGDVLAAAWDAGRFRMGDWGLAQSGPADRNGWVLLLAGVVWALQRYAVDQHLVQRYLAARSDREARRAAYLGAVACVPIWCVFLLLGAAIWGYYALSGSPPPDAVLARSSAIVPHFILHECPKGALGLIVSALAAAAMSSLAADLNSLATVVVDDFGRRLHPSGTDRFRLRLGRCVVLAGGAAAVGLSLVWAGVESAIEFAVQLLMITTSGVLGLFALGQLSRRATGAGALCGIVAAAAFTAWGSLTALELPLGGRSGTLLELGALDFPLDPIFIGILSHVVLYVVGLVASRLVGRPADDLDALTLVRPTRPTRPPSPLQEAR